MTAWNDNLCAKPFRTYRRSRPCSAVKLYGRAPNNARCGPVPPQSITAAGTSDSRAGRRANQPMTQTRFSVGATGSGHGSVNKSRSRSRTSRLGSMKLRGYKAETNDAPSSGPSANKSSTYMSSARRRTAKGTSYRRTPDSLIRCAANPKPAEFGGAQARQADIRLECFVHLYRLILIRGTDRQYSHRIPRR